MGVVGGGGGDAVDEVLMRVVFEVGGAVGELASGGVLEENLGFAGEGVFREVGLQFLSVSLWHGNEKKVNAPCHRTSPSTR